jgi:hypothetical protein
MDWLRVGIQWLYWLIDNTSELLLSIPYAVGENIEFSSAMLCMTYLGIALAFIGIAKRRVFVLAISGQVFLTIVWMT